MKKIALALATTAILGFAAPAFAAEVRLWNQSGGFAVGGRRWVRLDYSAIAKPKPHHKSVHHSKQ